MKSLLPYIYDFLTFVFDNDQSVRYIKDVVLFGSVATGEYDKNSDIDLFVEVGSEDNIDKVEKILRESEKRFYTLVEKKWSAVGISMPIKWIVGCLDSYTWKEIKSDILSTGVSLYGKYKGIKEGTEHFSLFSYGLSKMDNKKKVLLIRKLFGYSQKRNSKKYSTEGYLKELGGIKIGRNSLLIPVEKSRNLQKFFISFKVTPEIREVWMRKY